MIFMRELDVLRTHAYKSYSLRITYCVWFGDVNHVYFDSVCTVCLGRDSAQTPAGFSAVINEGVFVCPVKLTLVYVLLTPVLFASLLTLSIPNRAIISVYHQGSVHRRMFTPVFATSPFVQVLESFKIMDYSLLLGVHNMDQAERERQMEGSQGDSDEKRPMAQQKALYSTAMESIQGGAACGGSIDTDET